MITPTPKFTYTTPLTAVMDQYFNTRFVPETMFMFAFLDVPVHGVKKVYFLNQKSN